MRLDHLWNFLSNDLFLTLKIGSSNVVFGILVEEVKTLSLGLILTSIKHPLSSK